MKFSCLCRLYSPYKGGITAIQMVLRKGEEGEGDTTKTIVIASLHGGVHTTIS